MIVYSKLIYIFSYVSKKLGTLLAVFYFYNILNLAKYVQKNSQFSVIKIVWKTFFIFISSLNKTILKLFPKIVKILN